jgi:hypothetical protein
MLLPHWHMQSAVIEFLKGGELSSLLLAKFGMWQWRHVSTLLCAFCAAGVVP